MILKIQQGDITEIKVDAIVNAANNELWMGSGVAGAIKRKGGVIIEEEAIKKGPIEHGGAIETTAGNLDTKFIIHAAGMRTDGYITEQSLENSVKNSLLLADSLAIKTIAFPAIGTGVAGFKKEDCAKIMFKTIKNHKSISLQEISIVLYDKESFEIFLEIIGKEEIIL